MIRRAKERFEKEEKHMVLRSDSYISLTHSLTHSFLLVNLTAPGAAPHSTTIIPEPGELYFGCPSRDLSS